MSANNQSEPQRESYQWSLSPTPSYVLILAHGAGTDMNHSFLQSLTSGFQRIGHVLRFNFPYILQGRKSPGSPASAIGAIGEMVQHAQANYPDLPIFLSGKSYGGRMASHWLAENPDATISGIIYFGFPLHPSGAPSIARAAHLPKVKVPQLFLQGTNDALADIDLIQQVMKELPLATLEIIDGADHGFKLPKKLGLDAPLLLVAKATNWMDQVLNR
jgi:uncharacterized protein